MELNVTLELMDMERTSDIKIINFLYQDGTNKL